MRDLIGSYLTQNLSRRGLFEQLVAFGLTAAAAESLIRPLDAAEAVGAGDDAGIGKVSGTGGDAVVAQMKAAGVKYLFTNPGSFEVGLFDAFHAQNDMQLIVSLHEGLVVSTADGYHRMSGNPAFVNLHVIAGTAQAAGQMYNASRDGSALVVTAGLNDNEMWSDEGTLAPRPGYDQKDVNQQFTKISWEAREPRSLALMVRRAFKAATMPPGGPVYLALAHHALEAKGVEQGILPGERFMANPRPRPSKDAVARAARLLVEARNPMLVAGDEVWKAGAQDDLIRLSEALGLPVSYIQQGYWNFPSHHPHYAGRFSMKSDIAKAGMDVILSIGSPDFGGRVVPQTPEAPLDAKFIRMGMNTGNIGRNYPTDQAMVCDVREGLRDLIDAVESMTTADRRAKIAKPRSANLAATSQEALRKTAEAARANSGQSPIHSDQLGAAMARGIDKHSIVVGENLTGKHGHLRMGHRDDEVMWLSNTGLGLGWGIGAATGAKLAAPDRDVICSIGDGSVMYSASGFWTQARYEVPVLTVVWNNRNYQTVRHAYHRYKGNMAGSDEYTGMYLGDPDIDFVKLADSQGVSGEQVNSSADLDAAFKRGRKAIRDGKPYVLDVNVARYGGGADSTWHQKFSLAKQGKPV